jgi:16S rRNA (uracil1498-N3)-methyltransferase
MRNPRIFSPQQLSPEQKIDLEEAATRHLSQVLRLRPGMEIILFNGDGREYRAELTVCNRNSSQARVIDASAEKPPPPISIHLAIGISKGERMEFALQKSVELGVTEITPLFTQRCVVQLQGERLEKRLLHWRNKIIAACEQSGRCRIPQLHPAIDLAPWLDSRNGGGILLDHRSTATLPDLSAPTDNTVCLLIGPEGGLDEHERELATTAGFEGVRLGPRIMRTETAPLAAITGIQLLWGDLR